MPAKHQGKGNIMWRFKKLEPGDPERRPREAEFFNVGDNDVAASLVREAIQNSLDARLSEKEPVRVRFAFSSQKKDIDGYYAGLIEHIESCKPLPPQYEIASESAFLMIEDFGTLGLGGPVTLEEVNSAKPGNYYDFWWGEGKSQKTGAKAGRWGLGKTVFNVASGLRSFWGYTIRHDDGRGLLLGKAVLDTHLYKGERYNCYGYYTGDYYKPIEAKGVVNDFKKAFGIVRDSEPGLSVAIPMLVPEVNAGAVLRWSIINYFFPIIKGMLVVEVSNDGEVAALSASTLRETARKQNWEDTPWEDRNVESLMEFLEDAATTPESKNIFIKAPEGATRFKEELFGDKLAECRGLFDECQLLSLNIPVRIHRKGEVETSSHFDLYLKKDETLTKADEFYFRAGITVSEIRKLGNRKVRGLLSAHDDGVCAFLGDCESPAHTDWKERAEGFQDKYQGARDTLRFIKSSMAAEQHVIILGKHSHYEKPGN